MNIICRVLIFCRMIVTEKRNTESIEQSETARPITELYINTEIGNMITYGFQVFPKRVM